MENFEIASSFDCYNSLLGLNIVFVVEVMRPRLSNKIVREDSSIDFMKDDRGNSKCSDKHTCTPSPDTKFTFGMRCADSR